MMIVLLVALLCAQPELQAQRAAVGESMTTRGLRQSGLLPVILAGVSNTQFSIDALAQSTLNSQGPRTPSQNQPEPAVEKTKPVFRICHSAQPIPEELNAHYAKMVRAFRQRDADRIRELSLPGSVMIGSGFPYNGYGSQERISLNGDVNLQFAKDTGLFGFSADVLSVTKHSEDAFLLRTATSGLSFTKTAKSGWKLYAYFDRPAKFDKPVGKEKDDKSATGSKGEELDKLQGRWSLQNVQDDLKLAKQGFAKYILVIQGDRISREYEGGRKVQGRFKLAPDKNPQQIDLMWDEETPDLRERIGIYMLDVDKLTICYSTVASVAESRRPTDFTTEPGSGRVLLEFVRMKKPLPTAKAIRVSG